MSHKPRHTRSKNDFGVTVVLAPCAFATELQRVSISQIMNEIDTQLTEDKAPDDNTARVEIMMDNAMAIAAMVANRQIDCTEGVADIAYAFIYALGKTAGFDQINDLRGLTATFLQNKLTLTPCYSELEYQSETAKLQRAMAESEDGGWMLSP